VSINSSKEQAALEQVFMRSLGDRMPYWMGFDDAAVEGAFVWVSGQPVTYLNWNPGQPNNNLNQDYGVINLDHAQDATERKGTWNDTYVNGSTSSGTAGGPYRGIMELPLPGGARFFATNLPASLSLDTLTGRITGTPTTAGTIPVTLVLIASNAVAEIELRLTIQSALHISQAHYYPAGLFIFEIEAAPGETYAVEYKDDFGDAAWPVLATITGPTTLEDESAHGRSRFYRLRRISP